MAAVLVPGQRTWSLERDDEGHRTYKVVHLVRADVEDGPATVMETPGLPLPGAVWAFDNDVDAWAICWPTMSVTPLVEHEPNRHWHVEQIFSTKSPGGGDGRCQDMTVQDPLMEPAQISGSFVRYTKEAAFDRHGNLIKSSSHEQFRGPQVEFDANRPTVQISHNVAALGLDVFSQMVDTVNDAPMWGLPPRCIKLSNVSWERKIFGACGYYFTRRYEFDVDFKTFDREILDEGTKAIGYWNPQGQWVGPPLAGDPGNPGDFSRYQDKNGNIARVILNGGGLPANAPVPAGGLGAPTTGPPGKIKVEYYPESNFALLGIPATL